MKYGHVDEHGAITQHPRFGADEGDSAFFCGHFELLRHYYPCIHHKTITAINPLLFFPDKDGKLVRHAKAKKEWIREKDRGSRDQYTSWICLFTAKSREKTTPALKCIARVILKRGGFFTNTRKNGALKVPRKVPDIIAPDLLSILLRGLLGKWGYPLYYVLDLYMPLDVLFTRFIRNDSDVANHVAILMTAKHEYPTMWSKLALKLTDKQKIQKWLQDYFTVFLSDEVELSQVHRNPPFIEDCYSFAILKGALDD